MNCDSQSRSGIALPITAVMGGRAEPRAHFAAFPGKSRKQLTRGERSNGPSAGKPRCVGWHPREKRRHRIVEHTAAQPRPIPKKRAIGGSEAWGERKPWRTVNEDGSKENGYNT